jgi:cytidine deaminase
VFEEISVSSKVGATPCGMCRQTLHEFSGDGMVVSVDDIGKGEISEYTLSEMYPFSFPG